MTRFERSEELYWDLAPEFFTFIISSKKLNESGEPKLYATCSARRPIPHARHYDKEKAQLHSVNTFPDDADVWVLKMLSIDPEIFGQGIGFYLQQKVEAEIKERTYTSMTANASTSSTGVINVPRYKVHIILTSMAETNEKYYRRNGYKVTGVKTFPPGFAGSILEWHMLDLEKTIEL
jgi:GNAT superfamily N-acetyltransferase